MKGDPQFISTIFDLFLFLIFLSLRNFPPLTFFLYNNPYTCLLEPTWEVSFEHDNNFPQIVQDNRQTELSLQTKQTQMKISL